MGTYKSKIAGMAGKCFLPVCIYLCVHYGAYKTG
nr:MAG TPA: hypothetical protein [Caudoviricetes sp.]